MFTRRNSAFGPNERLGVLLIVEAAFVSVLAVTGVLLYIAVSFPFSVTSVQYLIVP